MRIEVNPRRETRSLGRTPVSFPAITPGRKHETLRQAQGRLWGTHSLQQHTKRTAYTFLWHISIQGVFRCHHPLLHTPTRTTPVFCMN